MRLDPIQDLLLGQGVIKSESGARVGTIAEPLGGEPRRDAMPALERHKKIQLRGSTYQLCLSGLAQDMLYEQPIGGRITR